MVPKGPLSVRLKCPATVDALRGKTDPGQDDHAQLYRKVLQQLDREHGQSRQLYLVRPKVGTGLSVAAHRNQMGPSLNRSF